MSDFDDEWSRRIALALEEAKNRGNSEAFEYLSLRAANDEIRRAGITWLFEVLIGFAAESNREHPAISIEKIEPHSFAHQGANLVGARLELRQGVRCLIIEAGWTRTPSDGFMRRGALAIAKIVHFGMSRENVELLLKAAGEGIENIYWSRVTEGVRETKYDIADIKRHFHIFRDALPEKDDRKRTF